jgi:hypothetical protein
METAPELSSEPIPFDATPVYWLRGSPWLSIESP